MAPGWRSSDDDANQRTIDCVCVTECHGRAEEINIGEKVSEESSGGERERERRAGECEREREEDKHLMMQCQV